jgi:Zn-dependent protease
VARQLGSPRSPLNGPSLQSVRLFRLFGIQFTANWSWLFLFLLLVYVAFDTFRALPLRVAQPELWLLAVIAAVLSVASLYTHELAHAIVARAYGIPVRTISLFLLGGMAHITRESPSPRAEFLIAMAGPVASLVIGVVGLLVSLVLRDLAPPLAALGFWLATMNIPLGIFNLVPAFPLDGGRVLRGLLWFAGQDLGWASGVSARVGQLAAVGLLFSGVWILFEGGGALSGLWLILIAWFMYAGAASSQYASAFHDALRRLTVASVMDRDFGRVQAGLSVQAFAEAHLLEKRAAATPHAYAVYRDDSLIGLLSLRQLGQIPMHSWSQTSIERATLPIESAPAMEPSAPALGALHLILEEGVEHIAVMAEGRLLGLVTHNELARAGGPSLPTPR